MCLARDSLVDCGTTHLGPECEDQKPGRKIDCADFLAWLYMMVGDTPLNYHGRLPEMD